MSKVEPDAAPVEAAAEPAAAPVEAATEKTTFTGSLTWRRASKAFGTEGPAPDLTPILDAIHMTPTCFGIMPFRVAVVTKPETIASLPPVCYGQKQVGQASAVLVFCAKKDNEAASKAYVDEHKLAENAPPYAEMIMGYAAGVKGAGASEAWASKQAYIGLGFAVAAAAEHRIASCPMEGFDPAGVGGIVGAAEDEFVAVIMCVGRTHPDDAANTGGMPQWRWPKEKVIQML